MRKKYSKKKMLTLVMSMIMLSSLLGISYAQWTKSIIIETKITSGTIEATGEAKSEYMMCANVDCVSGDNHRQNPEISIKLADKSIPIEVRKVEIVSFEYTAEIWAGDWVEYKYQDRHGNWIVYRKDWEGEIAGLTKQTLTTQVQNILCNYEKNNNVLTISIVGSNTQNGDWKIKRAMDKTWTNNRPNDRPAWADIHVGEKGQMTLRITYTQFNTKRSGGWEKTMEVKVPVSWNRLNGWENSLFPGDSGQNHSIKPGDESSYK